MRIKAKDLATTQVAVAKNDTRFMLQGIHIRNHNDSIQLEASNGHIAVRVQTDEPATAPSVVIKFSPEFLRETAKRKNADIYATVDAEQNTVNLNGTTYPLEVIDIQFPDIDRIFPDKPSDERDADTALQGQYLAAAAKVAKLSAPSDDDASIVLRHNGMSAALLTFPCAPRVAMLVMPIRVETLA